MCPSCRSTGALRLCHDLTYFTAPFTNPPGARLGRSKQPIYADLKRKVRAHFGEEGIKRGDHKCTWAAWARYMFFTFMFVVSLHAWINGKWW